jgi:hypothetical protein
MLFPGQKMIFLTKNEYVTSNMRVWNKNKLDQLIFVLYKMANIELSNEWSINVFGRKFEDIFKFEMVQIKMNTLY